MILGWDIGGVNTKAVRLDDDGHLQARSRPFELQREPGALVRVLADLGCQLGASAAAGLTCAVTMTAELSQMFRTKRDGVAFVLDAVVAAFPDANLKVFTTDGTFVTFDEARDRPLAVAAANWAATARLVAERYTDALLVDIGTTTTDIIPIVNGEVVVSGLTDPDRLASGELVYTGALRTPVEAIVRGVPYRGGRAAVSAEGFALIGDVHLWRGRLASEDYTVPTSDGRAASREGAGERLARVICADREMLEEADVAVIADAVAAEQVETVAAAIRRVGSRHPSVQTAVVTGLGDFIARDAAIAAGLDVSSLASEIGGDVARYAPAAAVALLARVRVRGVRLQPDRNDRVRGVRLQADQNDRVALIIKVGGGLLGAADHKAGLKAGPYENKKLKAGSYEDLDRVLQAVSELARSRRVLVVPGGGPFADVVREVDDRLGLTDDAAHWMAILGMDQYAHLLAARMPAGVVVSGPDQIPAVHRDGRIPILAPSRWLSSADPLPHSWDVTSDSIAAWVAGELRASQLLLVKPPDAQGRDMLDPHFHRVRPPDVRYECLPADKAIGWLRQQAVEMARSI